MQLCRVATTSLRPLVPHKVKDRTGAVSRLLTVRLYNMHQYLCYELDKLQNESVGCL